MNWKTASTVSLNASAKAHRTWEIPTTSWIDVFDVPQKLGIYLIFRPLGKLGAAVLTEPGAAAGIIVNVKHPLAKQRYSVAHELGHIFFKHPTTVDASDIFESDHQNLKTTEEKLAESFASWFLMPPRLMNAYASDRGITRVETPDQAYQLALFLGTSYQATVNHLRFTNRMSPARAASLLRIRPQQIKKDMLGADLPNWHNDVHALCDMDNKTSRLVRPGDRLIVELPEIPSSGFRWRLPEGAAFELERDEYVQRFASSDESIGGRTGVLQKRRLVFAVPEADERTSKSLTLRLARSWEAEPERIFSVEIAIEASRPGLYSGLLGLAA